MEMQKRRPNHHCPRLSSAFPRSMLLQLLSRLTQVLHPSERARGVQSHSPCISVMCVTRGLEEGKVLEAIGRACHAYHPIRGRRRIGYMFYAREGFMQTTPTLEYVWCGE